jgi:hypothetical protein
MMNQRFNPRWTLMQGLYYPAVLGTGLVLLINKFTVYKSFSDALADISIYFGLLILIYFSGSFLIIQTISQSNYGSLAFLSDIIEIIFIFFLFNFLGFFDPSNPIKIDFRWFYLLLAASAVLSQVWNYAVKKDKSFYGLAIIAITILLIGGLWGFHYVWFNKSMILVIGGLMGVYFHRLADG